jgi:hypothetical protein
MKLIKMRETSLYLLFIILGIFNAFSPTIRSGFYYMQSDPGDTRLNHYFLEHSFQLLTNKNYIGELFSPAFFSPYKNTLTFSDNLFGSAPIYWIFRSFLPVDLSYQIWMIVVCILCFVSFAVLMRYYRVSHVAAIIGAFLFAFGMPRIAQIGHQQLLPQFFTPLAFLFLWDFLKFPTSKRLALSLFFIYLQILAGVYLGWFLILSLIILTLIVCILDSATWCRLRIYFKRSYKAAIAITFSWTLLLFALFEPYIQIKKILGKRSYEEIDSMLPRISSWFLPAPNSLWSSLLSINSKNLPVPHEHHLFLGFLIILLTVISVYTLIYRQDILNFERNLIIKTCLLAALTIFVLTLRLPNGWSIWSIIYHVVPGASVIRAVTRIWTVFYFYLLVAVVLCLDSILNKIINRRLRIATVSFLCIGCLLEQIVISPPSFEKQSFTNEVAQIQKLIQTNCDVAYVTLNPENPFWATHLSAMWAGIKANVPIVNGYSGNVPPNYRDISKSMSIAQVIDWLGEDRKGRLCVISKQVPQEQDKLIYSVYSSKQKTSSLGTWNLYPVNLPIAKTFSQEIKLFEIPKKLTKSSVFKFPVIVKNTSNFLWSTIGKNPTNLSYRWIAHDGKQAVFQGDGDRTVLPFDLSPGESAALNAIIKTPTKPGKYTLILTMVQEFVAWFSDQQAPSPKIDVTVTSDY